MNKALSLIFLISLLASVLPGSMQAATSIPAFPGAEGWGAQSVGGRGGRVIEVTNLNDAGAGSLRACVEGSEFPSDYTGSTDRTCVFRVAGVINLNSPLRIEVPYITIAGQTAPGDGITLKGEGFRISTHNVIIRYIHYRGDSNGLIMVRSWDDAHDIIVDHCSASGGQDDMIDLFYNDVNRTDPDIRNITIQNCLIAEAHAVHPTAFTTGGLFDLAADPQILDDLRIHNISIHNNYFAENGYRNPKIKAHYTEVINNVVYNWNRNIGGTGNFPEVDWINNYWKAGPMSGGLALVFEWLDGAQRAFPLSSIYIAGNIVPPFGIDFSPVYAQGLNDPDQDNWFLFRTFHQEHGLPIDPVPEENRRLTPLAPAPYPVTIKPALTMFNSVVTNAGSNMRLNSDGTFTNNRDEVDQMFIDHFNSGTGLTSPPTTITQPSSIDPGTPYTDSDQDGMADEWEMLHFGDLTRGSALDSSSDADGDGYTDLEEFLNGTLPVLVNTSPTANAGPDQTLTGSATLDGSSSTDSDGTISTYVWKEGTTQIATGVTPTVSLTTGTHTITLTVTDNDGATHTDTVVITVNAPPPTTSPPPAPTTSPPPPPDTSTSPPPDTSTSTSTPPTSSTSPPPTIPEGALIRAIGDIDVYIVKYVGSKQFKRLVLSPSVFNNYGHLRWEDVQDIDKSTVDSFTTSELVRAVNDPKVYKLFPQGDTGEKRWITTFDAFLQLGFDWDAVYEINEFDRDSYETGLPLE